MNKDVHQQLAAIEKRLEAKIEQVRVDVHNEIFEIIPRAIATAISEAAKHLKMSEETEKRFKVQDKRIDLIEKSHGEIMKMLHENNKYHQDLAPLIEQIKSTDITLKKLKGWIIGTAALVAAMGVIVASFLDIISAFK